MTWAVAIAVAVISLALLRSLWSAGGPPWRWPRHLARALRRRRELRSPVVPAGVPDPFVMLHLQHRLAMIAAELRELQRDHADDTYFARAHRVHTRRHAYDQLLAEACRLAGIHTEHAEREGGGCRNEDERFYAETELAALGWHW